MQILILLTGGLQIPRNISQRSASDENEVIGLKLANADRWFLILLTGGFFAALNNSCKSPGTLANVVRLTKKNSEEQAVKVIKN